MTDLPDPLRLRFLKKVTETIEGVMVANGFRHDLVGKVFRGRYIFGDSDPLPAVSILEPPKEADTVILPGEAIGTAAVNDWDLIVQGWAKDDPVNPTDPLYVLMADVKRALIAEAKKDHPFDFEVVQKVTLGGGVIRPPEEGLSSYAFFWMNMRVTLVEDDEDPFS